MLDENYIAWKSWAAERFGQFTQLDSQRFSIEVARSGLSNISSVLEIGFGNGAFLGFARSRGWKVVGTERNVELVQVAISAGFDAVESNGLHSIEDSSFDIVVAFDVFEHLPHEELIGLIAEAKRKLKPAGALLARFPNGDSFLGLPHQSGDPTHITAIGGIRISQIASQLDLSVCYMGPAARPLFKGFLPNPRAIIAALISRLANTFIRFLYFAGEPVLPFSANMVVILKQRA